MQLRTKTSSICFQLIYSIRQLLFINQLSFYFAPVTFTKQLAYAHQEMNA